MKQQIEINESNKYNVVEIAKWVRQELKAHFKGFKFSVRVRDNRALYLSILKSPIKLLRDVEEILADEQLILRLQIARNDTEEEIKEMIKTRFANSKHEINHYYINSDWELTDNGKEIIKKINEIANKYNWDNSDTMTDYFDVNYYFHLCLGDWDKPFEDGKIKGDKNEN